MDEQIEAQVHLAGSTQAGKGTFPSGVPEAVAAATLLGKGATATPAIGLAKIMRTP